MNTEIKKDYYVNGSLHSCCSYKNNLMHGVHEYFFRDGRISMTINYKNGEKKGLVVYFYYKDEVDKKYFIEEEFHF